MLRRVGSILQFIFVVLFALLILLPILIVLAVLQRIARLPVVLGTSLRPELVLRKFAFSVFQPEVMRDFRDDVLHIVESRLEEDEDWERWGLLREIDQARENADDSLREGEFTFSILGGLSALLVGSHLGMDYLGVVLTLVTIFFSILVTARLIFVEVLAFRSEDHRHEPLRRLAVLRAWNRGPLNEGGEIGIAVASAFASKSQLGYNLGLILLGSIAGVFHEDDGKWRAE
ncbi:hypothetical protein [Halobacterium yunchengense]|uniref:hypothetical protein n=1 Tax=Halobacterium yunchengense TaxID=3108497 RepID=UPI00300959A7